MDKYRMRILTVMTRLFIVTTILQMCYIHVTNFEAIR